VTTPNIVDDEIVGVPPEVEEDPWAALMGVMSLHVDDDEDLTIRSTVALNNTWRDELGRFARKGYSFTKSTGTEMQRVHMLPKSDLHEDARMKVNAWRTAFNADAEMGNGHMLVVDMKYAVKLLGEEDKATADALREAVVWHRGGNMGGDKVIDEALALTKHEVAETFDVPEPPTVDVVQDGREWKIVGRDDISLVGVGERSIRAGEAAHVLAAAAQAKYVGNISSDITIVQRTDNAVTATAGPGALGYIDSRVPGMVNITSRAFAAGTRFTERDTRMASSNVVDDLRWITMHEIGHTAYFAEAYTKSAARIADGGNPNQPRGSVAIARSVGDRANVLYNKWLKSPYVSAYGKTKAVESQAEAFAEWANTGGDTDNPAVNDWANEFGWQTPPSDGDWSAPVGGNEFTVSLAAEQGGDDLDEFILVEHPDGPYTLPIPDEADEGAEAAIVASGPYPYDDSLDTWDHIDPDYAREFERRAVDVTAEWATQLVEEFAQTRTALVAAAAAQKVTKTWMDFVNDVLSDPYGDVILDSFVATGVDTGYFGIADLTIDQVLNDHLSNLSNFGGSSRQNMLDWLTRGTDEGLSVQNMRDLLVKESPLSAQRATLWARTELVSASNGSSFYAMLDAGATKKQWLATPDERTRDTHIAADKQKRAMVEDFEVGSGFARYPGDHRLPVGERVNCRCTLLADGFSDTPALTKKQLKAAAAERGIVGRSRMNKARLAEALVADVRLDYASKAQLLVKARAADVTGRYRMNKATLLDALRG
jgi:hypothetical protein